MMTQEEKARRYDEVLEQAKSWYVDAQIDFKKSLEALLPELKESENERMRQEIIKVFKTLGDGKIPIDIHYADIFTWLEKQGKQKEYTFKSIPRLLDMIEPSDKAKAYCQKLIDTLAKEEYNTDAKIVEGVLKGWNGEDVPMAVMDEKQGEKKPAWSEDDEKRLQSCINILKAKSLMGKVDTANTMWLKSLKERIGE